MSGAEIVGIVAVGAAVLQVALMGFIGYPIARRRPGGMAAFRRSGFTWWLGVLILVTVLGLIALPDTHSWWYPSQHGASFGRLLAGAAVAFLACLAVELAAERIFFGARDSESRVAANAKYEGALPVWARTGAAQYVLLALVAVLEEFVFRGIALGSLWYEWDLAKGVAAGIVAVAFGFSHWYYGFRQITIKLMVGSVLVWAALTGGWVAAALAHVLLNCTLTAISARRNRDATAASR